MYLYLAHETEAPGQGQISQKNVLFCCIRATFMTISFTQKCQWTSKVHVFVSYNWGFYKVSAWVEFSFLVALIYLYVYTHAMMYVWRQEDNLWELALSYCRGSRDQTQATRLGNKCLYLLSHFTSHLGRILNQPTNGVFN